MRFRRPADDDRDFDRGGPRSDAASRMQDLMGVVNMASSLVGGAATNMGSPMNLSGGSLNIQLLGQLGIDPSSITNQVFVANVSTLLSCSTRCNLFVTFLLFNDTFPATVD